MSIIKDQMTSTRNRLIDAALQYARMHMMGYYKEKDYNVIVSGSDRKYWEDSFLGTVRLEAESLLRAMASDDSQVFEETETSPSDKRKGE